jgi:diphosphomevalonate decarboxylase
MSGLESTSGPLRCQLDSTAQATAIAHPNIALVKYWGKRDEERNVPAVGSISITLDTLSTETTVAFDGALECDQFELDGRPAPDRTERVVRCLDLFRSRVTDAGCARVTSRNSFPTGAGLASSASGFAALVVAVDHALGTELSHTELADLARQCSGSAARSLFGGFVELGFVPGTDRRETTTTQLLGAEDWPLAVAVAIVSAAEKPVGSTAGMRLTARTSPYYPAWVTGADRDLDDARSAIERRDFEALAAVAELSCLKMHAVALAARPGLLYWHGATVDCLHRIRELRRQGTPVFFTVDAGPQVKAICMPEVLDRVRAELAQVPGVESLLCAGLGDGARVLSE